MPANKTIQIGTFLAFLLILCSGGLLFFVLPAQQVSEIEKRELSAFPRFSEEALLQGYFMDSLDLYISDHFPYRDTWVSWSFKMADWRGLKNKNETFIQTAATTPEMNEEELDAYLNNESPLDSASFTSEKGDESNGLIILDGKAYQVFGGSQNTAAKYAEIISEYRSVFPENVRIYNVVVPTASSFINSTQYQKMAQNEKNNIDAIYSSLVSGVTPVRAYEEIARHRNEYVYFGTDHHWTAKGAYYAYVAFCSAAGLTPADLGTMKEKSKPGFYGTLYAKTQNESMQEHPDTVFYWLPNVVYKTEKYTKTAPTKPVATSLFVESASGGNSYSVFLGGDYPLMKVTTGIATNRKVLVVKNSYGNPFSCFMVNNFREVYIVDYRYFSLGLEALVKEQGITDVVFINGVFSANTAFHMKRLKMIKDPIGNVGSIPADTLQSPSNPDSLITQPASEN